jgi:hypothetical protein
MAKNYSKFSKLLASILRGHEDWEPHESIREELAIRIRKPENREALDYVVERGLESILGPKMRPVSQTYPAGSRTSKLARVKLLPA